MRRAILLFAVLALCLPMVVEGQSIQYKGAGISGLSSSGTALTSTVPLLLPDGSAAAPALAFADANATGLYRIGAGHVGIGTATTCGSLGWRGVSINHGAIRIQSSSTDSCSGYLAFMSGPAGSTEDLFVRRDAANTLALRNGTNAQTFNIYNSFTTYGSNFGAFQIVASSNGTDLIGTGAGATAGTGGLRSIQGSKSKALTDNTATAFVRLTVADDDYEACAFGWTAFAEDADTDARQVTKGRTNVAILNNSGTETCVFSASADDIATNATAGTLACTFDCAAGTNTVDLRATCDTSLDAAAETLTFEYRLDCESPTTVTPQ